MKDAFVRGAPVVSIRSRSAGLRLPARAEFAAAQFMFQDN